jgi:hypothetical protein
LSVGDQRRPAVLEFRQRLASGFNVLAPSLGITADRSGYSNSNAGAQ